MATVKIRLYKQKQLKDGTHPILLVISHNYKRKRISLGISCRPDQWDEDLNLLNASFPNFTRKNQTIQKALFRAEDIVSKFQENGRPFSWEEFEDKFRGVDPADVFQYFDEVSARLKATGNVSNSNVYKCARNVLSRYSDKPILGFCSIDYAFLTRFEEDLRKRGVKGNSISNYLRTLRALFNKAIKEKKCPPECYPFKAYKISKLKEETRKLALHKEEIKKIKSFEPAPNTKQWLSKQIFLFIFYNKGMNFMDIARLEWKDISDGRITYSRSKTRNKTIISIKILPPVQEILDVQKALNPNSKYVFPILDKKIHDTEEKIINREKSRLKLFNKHLKVMAKEVGIDENLTSYVFRHSWATILKREGVSTSIISEGMGHDSEKATQIYLDSFENKTLDDANEKLLDL